MKIKKTLNVTLVIILSFITLLNSYYSIILANEPNQITIFDRGSKFKYLNDETNVFDEDWTMIDYDDSTWNEGYGSFGFGNYPFNTSLGSPSNRLTYFNFRKTFNVDKDAVKFIEASIIYDDAAVVYLNGEEIFRANVEGEISASTRAIEYVVTAKSYDKFNVPINKVLNGENIIAVAVFQDSPSSSDIYFDMDVIGYDYVVLVDDYLPQAVTLTFYDDPISSRGFSWYTGLNITEGWVQLFKGENGTTKESVDFNHPNTINISASGIVDSLYYTWKAHINDLELGERYFYRVGSLSDNIWSQVGEFKVSDGNLSTVKFIHTTDAQESNEAGYRKWAETIEKAYEIMPDADFMAFKGDLVNTSTILKQWNWALNLPKDHLMDNVIAPVAGNHDAALNSFANHFNIKPVEGANTSSGIYYSFDYGDIHFTFLNTNDPPFDQNKFMSDTQLAWLENDLKTTDKPWKIIVSHKGLISQGNHTNRSDTRNVRTQLLPLMAQYEVDLFLQGHDHVYFRLIPYSWDSDGRTVVNDITYITEVDNDNETLYAVEPNGTTYLTINYSGTKRYDVKADYNSDLIKAAKNPYNNLDMILQPMYATFGTVEIKDNQLVYNTYLIIDGSPMLYDTFAILKKPQIFTENLISELPDIEDFEDLYAESIIEAYDSYNSLTSKQQNKIDPDLIAKLNSLVLKLDIDAYYIGRTFNDTIINLGPVLNTSQFEDELNRVYFNYLRLTNKQQIYVSKYHLLVDKINELDELKLVDYINELIDSIDNNSITYEEYLIMQTTYDNLDELLKPDILNNEKLIVLKNKFIDNDVEDNINQTKTNYDIYIYLSSYCINFNSTNCFNSNF